ncbi:MAG TPA: hypothetical protein VJQ54_12275 [Candidatus Sulfotelmatobacter sp.]|nr:hypothetical protein [Candidatus Sulfotelmatobacter sp.]
MSLKGIATLVSILILNATLTVAQSSGSFNFNSAQTECTDTSGLLGSGVSVPALKTTMKVSSGSGNVLVIRPSAVVGLLTDVTVNSKNSTGSSQSGVNFTVTVTPLSGQPGATVTPNIPVTYEDRYIQISTNLFQAIAAACTTLDPINGCYFNFNETTLSAHSFDWVVSGLSAGTYGIEVDWSPYTSANAPNTAQTCVGPVVLTAEQAKIFNQSTGISF